MKRIGVTVLLLALTLALSGPSTGTASAALVCRKVNFFAWYYKDGTPECEELAIVFAWKGWDLVESGGKEIEKGVVCALVESGAPSDYDGPNCGVSEEVEGKSEYVKASTETEEENKEKTKKEEELKC
jgi:hypothetical protein